MPLFNVCGLGFSWPLAEARACALAAAMKGDALAEFDASLLHRIDTAANPLALAVQCSSRFSGFSRSELQLLVQKISSRQVMAVRLQRLQDSVQSQWITQFVKYGLRTSDSPEQCPQLMNSCWMLSERCTTADGPRRPQCSTEAAGMWYRKVRVVCFRGSVWPPLAYCLEMASPQMASRSQSSAVRVRVRVRVTAMAAIATAAAAQPVSNVMTRTAVTDRGELISTCTDQ